MRLRIALGMAEVTLEWDQALEMAQQVGGHVGIPVFRDDHGGGGMGNEEIAQTGAHHALRDRMRDLAGDIDQLHALLRANPNLNHHTAILWPGAARRQPRLYRLEPRARFHRAANSLSFGQSSWRQRARRFTRA